MDKRIVLVGAGSSSFGPSMFADIYLSKVLRGSTVVLHDKDKKKLEMIYELLVADNKIKGNFLHIERTTNRKEAFTNADFIISSIEIGERFKLWRQDYEVPRKHGSSQILGECGGPGGSIHAFRILPEIINIVQDAEKICAKALFINFSNPMSRVCLAIKRATSNLKFIGLCHQIGGLEDNLIMMFGRKLEELLIYTGGLNHFGFLLGLREINTGLDLMPVFNSMALNYFNNNKKRFGFSDLSIEVYKRFGWFCYAGDNHMGEYVQFAEDFTKTQDMVDWINRTDKRGNTIYNRMLRYHQRLIANKYPKSGFVKQFRSGERAIPIIESILLNGKTHENAVNIPNTGIITNLPEDLVLECSANVDKKGVHGIKIGNLPKTIASILRIEASVQDLCVEAVLQKSKELAITSLAIDPNVGSFKKAENIFDEICDLQREYLSYFK